MLDVSVQIGRRNIVYWLGYGDVKCDLDFMNKTIKDVFKKCGWGKDSKPTVKLISYMRVRNRRKA